MQHQNGQIIENRYRIVSLLGQGGFGAVYRAYDLHLQSPCALKENLETSPAAQRQFEREATILARLSHPNLPRVTDHFFIPGQGQYLVMDYIEGYDLHTLVEKSGALQEPVVLGWAYQVLNALEYLHNQNPPILHRDVKPANLRVRPPDAAHPQGLVTLVDFGLVKRVDGLGHTTTGALAVSPGYSPPEQYGQGTTDPRSDIYALGATLYTALTGLTPQESVMRISHDEVRPAHQVNPRVSTRTSFAIQKSLALSASARFKSAAEFHQALGPAGPSQPNAVAGARPASAPPQPVIPNRPSTPPSRPPALVAPPVAAQPLAKPSLWHSLKWPAIIGGALVLLMGILIIGLLLLRPWETARGTESSSEAVVLPTRTSRSQPTPYEDLNMGGIDVSAFSTQTAQAVLTATGVTGPTPVITFTPWPTDTWIAPTPTSVGMLGGIPRFDLAFASNHYSDFGVILYSTTTGAMMPLSRPEGYELAWWPSFCNMQVLAEVQDLDGNQAQWIAQLDPTAGVAYLWDPPDPFEQLGVPRCSHRAQYIAYSGNGGGGWYLYLAYTDNSDTFILDNDGISGYGSWTYADDRLYYITVSGSASGQVRTIGDLPGRGTPVNVTSGKYPEVSPDGRTLAYMCSPSGDTQYDLCTYDLASGRSTRIHEIVYLDVDYDHDPDTYNHVPASPAWSADGQWIYFSSAEDGDWDIYRVHPDGSGLQNITPSWDSQELMPATQW